MVRKLGAFYTQIPCYFTQLPNPGRQPTKIGDPPSLFSGAAYLKNIRHKMNMSFTLKVQTQIKFCSQVLEEKAICLTVSYV
jgi:hypothetical protein